MKNFFIRFLTVLFIWYQRVIINNVFIVNGFKLWFEPFTIFGLIFSWFNLNPNHEFSDIEFENHVCKLVLVSTNRFPQFYGNIDVDLVHSMNLQHLFDFYGEWIQDLYDFHGEWTFNLNYEYSFRYLPYVQYITVLEIMEALYSKITYTLKNVHIYLVSL